MVQVSYPGVYIEEVPSGVRTITGVSTSIGAFFGRTAKGPLNKALRCFSLSDFNRAFGGAHPASDLAQSIRLFFDNGGADCYVVRLAHNALKADVTLQNADDTNVLTASAKYAGNWGNGIRLEVDYAVPNPEVGFNLRAIQLDGETEVASESFTNLNMNPQSSRFAPDFVSQSSDLIDLELAAGFDPAAAPIAEGYSEGRRPFDTQPIGDFRNAINGMLHPSDPTDRQSMLEMSVNGGPFITVDLSGDDTATAFGGGDDRDDIADEITNRINAQLGDVETGLAVTCTWEQVHDDFYVFRITSDQVDPMSSVRIRRARQNDVAGPWMLGLDQGGIEVHRYSPFRPVPTATFFSADINDLAELEQDAFNEITISGATVDLRDDTGTNRLETTDPSDRWYRDDLSSEVNDHNDGVREKLRIIARAVSDAPDVPARAEVWGYRLALVPTGGTINSTITVATDTAGGGGTDISGFFTPNVRRYALGPTGSSPSQDGPGQPGRDDDGNPPDVADYVGSEADQTGFHALDSVDLFNLMVLPGDEEIDEATHTQLWDPASTYCEDHRAFLLIDAPASWTRDDRPEVVQNTDLVNDLRARVVNDYSAVFYPRLRYVDRGIAKTIGPSGAVAGLMARIDSTRGVWKAAAGVEADLRGIVGLDVDLTDMENGVLNKIGVNCLRAFPSGFVSWGARTMDGADDIGSEWKYIPIRRLALFLEESLFRGTKWVVFEPNDEPLWANIRLNLNAFMMGLFRQGAFQGSTPDQAFYVKCDSETTTQADRNLGIVNIEVGFAPLKPAEFVVIRIQQIAGEL